MIYYIRRIKVENWEDVTDDINKVSGDAMTWDLKAWNNQWSTLLIEIESEEINKDNIEIKKAFLFLLSKFGFIKNLMNFDLAIISKEEYKAHEIIKFGNVDENSFGAKHINVENIYYPEMINGIKLLMKHVSEKKDILRFGIKDLVNIKSNNKELYKKFEKDLSRNRMKNINKILDKHISNNL